MEGTICSAVPRGDSQVICYLEKECGKIDRRNSSHEHQIRLLANRFNIADDNIVYYGRGEWCIAYLLTMADRQYVARFGPYAGDFTKDATMGEYNPRSFFMPKVLLVEPVEHLYLCLSDVVHGQVIDLIRDPAPKLADQLFDCVSEYRNYDPAPAVHVGDWSNVASGICSSWPEFLLAIADETDDVRTVGWRANLNRFPDIAMAFDKGIEALSLFRDLWPSGRSLIHADLLHGNVLFDERRRSLGIIDWGSSFYGDSLYEFASISYWAQELCLSGNTGTGRALLTAADSVARQASATESSFWSYRLHVGLQQLRFNASRGRTRAMRHHATRVAQLSAEVLNRS